MKRIITAAAVLALGSGMALADVVPTPYGINMLDAASPVAVDGHAFHDLLNLIIIAITIFVAGLMGYTMWRFSAKRNPVPSRTTHNTLIEVLWTVVPVIILVVIAIPSFKLLYFQDRTEQAELTIKAIGRQWYWDYEYPDHNFTFSSRLDKERHYQPGQTQAGEQRLLDVDNQVVLPSETNIRVLTTAGDVIHAWAVPSLFVKRDAVPGRTNETWTRIAKEHEGKVLYGQCSEICGVDHAYMPIAVRVVSKEEFQRWVAEAKTKFAKIDETAEPATQVAQTAAQ
ncbi:MAG TPA: cytochrome c oxidase subunit II [Alphaproteobacteria bacterium]|nr:cytochrome c oxidase subunit II [Alphaproteobacteria bacterium]